MAKTKKTILLGEAPGRGFDDQPAFSSRSGQRLSELLGVDVRQVFKCQNLLPAWPGKGSSKGAAFPAVEARQAAEQFMQRLCLASMDREGRDRRIILAGTRVAKAMRVRPGVPILTWTSFWVGSTTHWCGDHEFAVLPHPSGVNRWWNDPACVERARQFLLDEARLTGVKGF